MSFIKNSIFGTFRDPWIEDDPISYIWFKADIYNLDQSCPKIGELHGIKC